MGYTTWFNGTLQFNKQVTDDLKNFINEFANVRHMQRDVEIIKKINPNWSLYGYKGTLGNEGEYYVGGSGFMGQDEDASIISYNRPARGVPGLWCQWIINEDGELEWDGNEKFYNYEEWLNYLIDHFFKPEGYVLNGDISFNGENDEDLGFIHVVDNVVNLEYGICAYSMADISDEVLLKECRKRNLIV